MSLIKDYLPPISGEYMKKPASGQTSLIRFHSILSRPLFGGTSALSKMDLNYCRHTF